MKIVSVKIYKAIGDYKVGQKARIKCDDNGTPLDSWWRRRFNDAKTDFCLEIINEPAPKSKPKSRPKSANNQEK